MKTSMIRYALFLAGMWSLSVAADDHAPSAPKAGETGRHSGAEVPKGEAVSKKSEPIHSLPEASSTGHGASALGPGIHTKSPGTATVGGLAKSSAKHSAAVIDGKSTQHTP